MTSKQQQLKKDTVPAHKSITRTNPPLPAKKPQAPTGRPSNAKKPVIAAVKAAPPLKAKGKTVPRSAQAARSSALPRGFVSKPMMPKHAPKADGIQKRLKTKSPWFQSINDPLQGAACKIPDETGVDTGTFQIVEHHVLTIDTQGQGGLRVMTPYINSVPVGIEGVPDIGANVQVAKPLNGGGPPLFDWGAYFSDGDSTDFYTGAAKSFVGVEQIKDLTDAHRIVSSCLIVTPEPSLASDQGEFTLFVDAMANHIENNSTYSVFQNKFKSVSIPVNSNQPGIARWFPVARQDYSFKSFMDTTCSYVSNDDNLSDPSVPFWIIGVVASGCEEDTVFRCTIVVNYEFVPRFNTLNILGTTPSPQDATEVDLVENWVQEMPVAAPTTVRKAGASPGAVTVEHGENDEGTGFGMFFNVIKELAPLALALL